MKNVLSALIGIVVLLSVVSLADAKDKKKAKPSEPAEAQQLAGGWKDIKATPAGLVQASYRLDGNIIVVHFRNLSKDRTVRIKYQAKWKKQENGKWVDDASQEGVTIRLKKLDNLQKDILTRSKNIRDVAVIVEADEVS